MHAFSLHLIYFTTLVHIFQNSIKESPSFFLSLFFLTCVLRVSAALFKGNLEQLSSIFPFFVLPAICDLLIGFFEFSNV